MTHGGAPGPGGTRKEMVRDHFGRTAAAYVTSAQHAAGDDLAIVVELAACTPGDRVLDVATGAGHTALALAAHAGEVVATDLTPEMLREAQEFITGRGAANVTFEPADAEALPFPDGWFDVVVSRIAPHHFPDPRAFVHEAARVLRGGGRFVLDDNMAPDDPELDAFMNRVETWRDPSHVRACTQAEWVGWIEEAGLTVTTRTELAFKRHPFASWTERAQLPVAERARLEAWLREEAPGRCREYFQVEVDREGDVRAWSATWSVIAAAKPQP